MTSISQPELGLTSRDTLKPNVHNHGNFSRLPERVFSSGAADSDSPRGRLAGGGGSTGAGLGGAFRGEVRDASGAVVPHTKILIDSQDKGTETIAESDGEGLYVTPNLIPGACSLVR